MESWKKGSITVFMSLMLMVVASLLFTLLEGSRYMMLGMMAVINSQSVTESMFAEYHVPAYENYHLFMIDSSYGSGQLLLSEINAKMQKLGQENLNPSIMGFGKYQNFLQMNVTSSSVVQYELATDQDSGPLLGQAAEVMKQEAGVDLAEQIYQKVTNVQESCEKGKQTDTYLDGALDTLEQARKEAEESERAAKETEQKENQKIENVHSIKSKLKTENDELVESTVKTGNCVWRKSDLKTVNHDAAESVMETGNHVSLEHVAETEVHNPMGDVKNAKNSPLLAQILSDGDQISDRQISKEDAIEKRTLNTGNFVSSDHTGLIDKMLTIQYLKKYTSNYRNKINVPHALEYEQEYILFGKYSDEDNLKKMASRLLLLREGINFTYLMSDSVKCNEALAMATAIAAATGVPVAAKVIQMGLLASWAYAESIVELRTLFSGGKIAAVKSAESWTVSLPEAAVVLFHTSVKSKGVSSGFRYEDYLQAFLALEHTSKIGNRFANLLEKNLRLYEGYEQMKLDCMITAMETDCIYQAQQVFLTFVTIEHLSRKGYQYEEKYKFSYLDKKDSS